MKTYCPSPYHYRRRPTREVTVGKVGIGGTNPIRGAEHDHVRHDGYSGLGQADAGFGEGGL